MFARLITFLMLCSVAVGQQKILTTPGGVLITTPSSNLVVTPAWTPADITTEGWYDASDTNTITSAAGLVSQWDDKSGNSNHLSQLTGSLQPETGFTTLSTLNAIKFVYDEMTTSGANPFGATISNAVMVIVALTDSLPDGEGMAFTLTGSHVNGERWSADAPWSTGDGNFDVTYWTAPTRVSGANFASAGEKWFASWYCSTIDNVQEIYKNGSLFAGDATGHSVSTYGSIYFGSANSGQIDGRYQNFTVGEAIIINGTLSTATRRKLEGYLAWKWGLTGNLPSDHLYRYVRP